MEHIDLSNMYNYDIDYSPIDSLNELQYEIVQIPPMTTIYSEIRKVIKMFKMAKNIVITHRTH